MQGQKKLQDLFTDRHVPRAWRGNVPIFECQRGIAWVVGHRIAEWAKASDAPVVWIRFSWDGN